jgi:hypothetical protein
VSHGLPLNARRPEPTRSLCIEGKCVDALLQLLDGAPRSRFERTHR